MCELSTKIKKVGPAHVICVGAIRYYFFDARILRSLLRPRGSRKSKNCFAIESTDHVLACHDRGFFIFATWWRYRANGNLHWNFEERHPVADTTHVIHHYEIAWIIKHHLFIWLIVSNEWEINFWESESRLISCPAHDFWKWKYLRLEKASHIYSFQLPVR